MKEGTVLVCFNQLHQRQWQVNRWIEEHIEGLMGGWTDKQTDTETDRQLGRQTDTFADELQPILPKCKHCGTTISLYAFFFGAQS